jgi:hypothetical protein
MSVLDFEGYDYLTFDSFIGKGRMASLTNVTLVAGAGRNSTAALKISSTSTSAGYLIPAQSTVIVGGWFYIESALPTSQSILLSFENSLVQHAALRVNTAGTLNFLGGGTDHGTSTEAMSADTWHFVEAKITFHDTTGSAEIWLDATKVLDLPDIDTRNGTTPGEVNMIWIDWMVSRVLRNDSIYILNTAGSAPANDVLGNTASVDSAIPNANGATNAFTTQVPGTGSHYEKVDDTTTDDDTTYIESATAGHIDLFGFTALRSVVAGSQVLGVQSTIVARKDDASNNKQIRHVARPGSTNTLQGSDYVGAEYQSHVHLWTTNPDTASAWDSSEIDAGQFGVEVQS